MSLCAPKTKETLADLFRRHKQTRIAEHVGVSTTIVSEWASGRMDVFFTYIQPLTEFLGINRERFIDACIATSGRPPIGP